MDADSELLRRFAEEKSQADFAELVRRNVNLVYAAALRRVRNPHHARRNRYLKRFRLLLGIERTITPGFFSSSRKSPGPRWLRRLSGQRFGDATITRR